MRLRFAVTLAILLALIVVGGILGVTVWQRHRGVPEAVLSPIVASPRPSLAVPNISPGPVLVSALPSLKTLNPSSISKPHMQISSPAFAANQSIPSKFTCDGVNISPPLTISDVPAEAKSLALIIDDPDAPQPQPWVHWLIWNIPVSTKDIPEGQVPAGAVQGQNGGGQVGFGGPCPPSGTHRYFFRLYALDISLGLSPGASREQLDQAMEGHIVDQGELVGVYKRSGK